MNTTFKTIAFSAVAFCATAAFAANQARVDVPFNFTAQGKSYPAGVYQVSTDSNHNFVTIANQADAGKHLTWTVGPTEEAKAATVLTFDTVGADYALKTIQIGNRVTQNLDTKHKGSVSATTSIGGQ